MVFSFAFALVIGGKCAAAIHPWFPYPHSNVHTYPRSVCTLILDTRKGSSNVYTPALCLATPPAPRKSNVAGRRGGVLKEAGEEKARGSLKSQVLAILYPKTSGGEEGPEPCPRLENALSLVTWGPSGPGDDSPRDAEGAPPQKEAILRSPHAPTWGRVPEEGLGGELANTPQGAGTPPKGSLGPSLPDGSRGQPLSGVSSFF